MGHNFFKEVPSGPSEEADVIFTRLVSSPPNSQCAVEALEVLRKIPDESLSVLLHNNDCEIIQLIKTYLNTVDKNRADSTKCLIIIGEILYKSIKRVDIEQKEHIFCQNLNFWLCDIVPAIFEYRSLRKPFLDIIEDLSQSFVKRDFIQHPAWHEFIGHINHDKRYISALLVMVKKNDLHWHNLWNMLIKIIGVQLLSNGVKINNLLSVIELAFKQPAEERCKAFECWKVLIDIFAINIEELLVLKRMKLLATPLVINNAKTPEVALIKAEIWWHLITLIPSQTQAFFSHIVITPYLEFSFGDVANSKSLVPGRHFRSVQELTIPAFVELVGHRECTGCIDKSFPRLSKPFLNASMLIKDWKIWLHSLTTFLEIISTSEGCETMKHDVMGVCVLHSFILLCLTGESNAMLIEVVTALKKISHGKAINYSINMLIPKLLSIEHALIQTKDIQQLIVETIFDEDTLASIARYPEETTKGRTLIIEYFLKHGEPAIKFMIASLPKVAGSYYWWQSTVEILLRMEPAAIRTPTVISLLKWSISNIHQMKCFTAWLKLYNYGKGESDSFQLDILETFRIEYIKSDEFNRCAIEILPELLFDVVEINKDNITKLEEHMAILARIVEDQQSKIDDGLIKENLKKMILIVLKTIDMLPSSQNQGKTLLQAVFFLMTRSNDAKRWKSITGTISSILSITSPKTITSIKAKYRNLETKLKTYIETSCDSTIASQSYASELKAKQTEKSPKTIQSIKNKELGKIKARMDVAGEEFVIVESNWKFNPKKLTDHQIETLKRKPEDIPALYQDLSQSQDNSNIQAWKTPGCKSDRQDESTTKSNSTESNCSTSQSILKHIQNSDIVPNIIKTLSNEKKKQNTAQVITLDKDFRPLNILFTDCKSKVVELKENAEMQQTKPTTPKSKRICHKERAPNCVQSSPKNALPIGVFQRVNLDKILETPLSNTSGFNETKVNPEIQPIKSTPKSKSICHKERAPDFVKSSPKSALPIGVVQRSNPDKPVEIHPSNTGGVNELKVNTEIQQTKSTTPKSKSISHKEKSPGFVKSSPKSALPISLVQRADLEKDVIDECPLKPICKLQLNNNKSSSILILDPKTMTENVDSEELRSIESLDELQKDDLKCNDSSQYVPNDIGSMPVNNEIVEKTAYNSCRSEGNNDPITNIPPDVENNIVTVERNNIVTETTPDQRKTRKLQSSESAESSQGKSNSHKKKTRILKQLAIDMVEGNPCLTPRRNNSITPKRRNPLEKSRNSTSARKIVNKIETDSSTSTTIDHSEPVFSEEIIESSQETDLNITFNNKSILSVHRKDISDCGQHASRLAENTVSEMDTEPVNEVSSIQVETIIQQSKPSCTTLDDSETVAQADTLPTDHEFVKDDSNTITEMTITDNLFNFQAEETVHLKSNTILDNGELSAFNLNQSITFSPTKDNDEKISELLNSTSDISPIKFQSPVKVTEVTLQKQCDDDMVILLTDSGDSDEAQSDISTDISPEKMEQSPPRDESSKIVSSPSCSKKSKNRIRPASRSAQMLGMCVPGKILTETNIFDCEGSTRIPSANTCGKRNLEALYNVNGGSNVSEFNKDDLFLEFKKKLPSPTSSPSNTILKRKIDDLEDSVCSPVAKKKRVSFHDPPVSTILSVQKYIEESGIRSPSFKHKDRQPRTSVARSLKKKLDKEYDIQADVVDPINGVNYLESHPLAGSIADEPINVSDSISAMTADLSSAEVHFVENCRDDIDEVKLAKTESEEVLPKANSFESCHQPTTSHISWTDKSIEDAQQETLARTENSPVGTQNQIEEKTSAVLSETKNIANECEKQDVMEPIISLESQPLTESMELDKNEDFNSTDPISLELVDCRDKISEIAADLSSTLMKDLLVANWKGNIETIGDLAKKTEAEVNRLSMKRPKVKTVRAALENYAQKISKKSLTYEAKALKIASMIKELDAEKEDFNDAVELMAQAGGFFNKVVKFRNDKIFK